MRFVSPRLAFLLGSLALAAALAAGSPPIPTATLLTHPCTFLAAHRPDSCANSQALSVDLSLPDDDSPSPMAEGAHVEPAPKPGPPDASGFLLRACEHQTFEGSRRLILLC